MSKVCQKCGGEFPPFTHHATKFCNECKTAERVKVRGKRGKVLKKRPKGSRRKKVRRRQVRYEFRARVLAYLKHRGWTYSPTQFDPTWCHMFIQHPDFFDGKVSLGLLLTKARRFWHKTKYIDPTDFYDKFGWRGDVRFKYVTKDEPLEMKLLCKREFPRKIVKSGFKHLYTSGCECWVCRCEHLLVPEGSTLNEEAVYYIQDGFKRDGELSKRVYHSKRNPRKIKKEVEWQGDKKD